MLKGLDALVSASARCGVTDRVSHAVGKKWREGRRTQGRRTCRMVGPVEQPEEG